MGIVGHRPETGLRCTLVRKPAPADLSAPAASSAAPPLRARYEGEIVASDGTTERLVALVDAGGAVSVTPAVESGASEALQKRAVLLLRTIVRECERDGRTQMPAKIVRWWGEK